MDEVHLKTILTIQLEPWPERTWVENWVEWIILHDSHLDFGIAEQCLNTILYTTMGEGYPNCTIECTSDTEGEVHRDLDF